MSRHQLKYGRRSVVADLPESRQLVPAVVSEPAAPETLVRAALAAPLGSPPLAEIVRPGERVAIVTSDITRYTGSEHYLPILVEQLNAAGVADADIEIVIALGIHRRQKDEERRRILGPLYGRIAVSDHAADDPAQLVDLGRTESGLPVAINRRVVEADRVIVTGTCGFHYFAGFGGGRKGLVPGVAARETCMATHFKVFNPPEKRGKHPLAAPGVLEGNPIHAAILAAAKLVRPDFLLNTVLTPDKRILEVFCGGLEPAHAQACRLVRQTYGVELAEPADLAVISCGGHPKDINFIQAHKSLDYGSRAVRPGGTIILLAACPDGFGHENFFHWFEYQDLDEFETALRANYEIYGQTAHATLSKARTFRVILVSGLNAADTRRMGMEKAEDLDAALRMAYEELPAGPRTVVIPDGGTVLPVPGTGGRPRAQG